MRFRHPTGVRLTTQGGHITWVGPEWRELHADYHRTAMNLGCECDQAVVRTMEPAPAKPSENSVVHLAESDQIRKAMIAMIERNGPDDFTSGGTPNLTTLAKEIGFRPDKSTALEIWHAIKAEAISESEASSEQS